MIPILYAQSEKSLKKISQVMNRNNMDLQDINETAAQIVKDVFDRGDEAVVHYTKQFDNVELEPWAFLVSEAEIQDAYRKASNDLIFTIKKAISRIRNFHEKQKMNSWFDPTQNGEILGQMVRPLQTVGVYVPGGRAAYPSSVLMNMIPAKVAGVSEIVMVTPAGKDGVNPATIVAASEAEVSKIYKIGGAQAIAALACGTETIPKVDKIVGPGNIYVAAAKRSVYGYVDIDSIAGPSEILIIADHSANPVYVAADMLSQAEHDEMAAAILVCCGEQFAVQVQQEIRKQAALLERKSIIEASLHNYGAIIVATDLEEAADICNDFAPEHLELCVADPFHFLTKIRNAGAIFLGNYSPEPLGDYMAGPNHVLPTGGSAKFFSPLSVDDFIKKSSIISFSRDALALLKNDVIQFANAEGLTAHANAIRVRFEDER